MTKVRSLRKIRQRGVITGFDPEKYEPDVNDFVKIGDGPIGGKARGLAFMWAYLQRPEEDDSIFSRYAVAIPKSVVISADGFDDFPHASEYESPDLPCPWCRAATREDDPRCPSCGQRFG